MTQNMSLVGAAPNLLMSSPHSNESSVICTPGLYDNNSNNINNNNRNNNISLYGSYIVNTLPTNLAVMCSSLGANASSEVPLGSENYNKFDSELSPAGDIIVAVYLVMLGEFVLCEDDMRYAIWSASSLNLSRLSFGTI
ncbi:hypothetical protein ElyMa_002793500 [Elysia marginata]|uniref:Uncharacterized protein n=1 Tax=Elysia marginata TaxID=1093978 RepID=A0AAV4HQJ1_9GAST|nr:hypothetical protein ElyMa_002793500 [Elysia marginata]